MKPTTKLPITIITGYLGAGKTTLVNNLLRNPNGLKLAILVNEFGALAIDEDLIIARDENMISIAGGCVCCSYGNDLMLSLAELLKLNPRPHHIIIEASGVAIPSSIANSISLVGECYTESIIALIDADQIQELKSDKYVSDTINAQIMDADLILINKLDLINDMLSFKKWLELNPPLDKGILISEANIPLENILGNHRFKKITTPRSHNDVFWSKTYIPKKLLDPKKFVNHLTQEAFKLVRSKGYIKGLDNNTYLIQTVGPRSYITEVLEEKNIGIVLIGSKTTENPEIIFNSLSEI